MQNAARAAVDALDGRARRGGMRYARCGSTLQTSQFELLLVEYVISTVSCCVGQG